MIRLKIRDNYYRIINGYRVNESSREVKFSTLIIDFTNKTIADLPIKYQEVQLLDLDDDYSVKELIYTGYVNNFILPKMKNREEYRELEIDLLSPLALATVRTVDAVGTYNLQTLIRELVQPLIDDGFVLKELNVGDNQVSVNYLNETVESSLNKLSNKHNFWWYIDQNKNIYINSISYLMSLKPKIAYDDNNKINGLIDVIPSIDATDYCNMVNFVNTRMYVHSNYEVNWSEDTGEAISENYSYPLFKKTKISSGEKIEFENPFDISVKAFKKMYNVSSASWGKRTFSIYAVDAQNNVHFVVISYNLNTFEPIIPQNVTISDDYNDSNEWVFVRDPFFKNLIVGLQYNGSSSLNVYTITSLTTLIWAKVKIQDNIEINNNKGIISETGIVEKQIDMQEQWKTLNELTDIANSYININVSRVDQVDIKVDKDINLKIGDTIKINKECFLINDTYIVTDKTSSLQGNVKEWDYSLKNTNVLENYVDLFRARETQEQEEKQYNLITSDYISEGIKETYEVIVNAN